jgi:hypothetical protein
LSTENRIGAGAGAVGFESALVEDKAKEAVILLHGVGGRNSAGSLFLRRGADVAEFAIRAIRLAGGATAASVENEPVAEKGPGVAGDELDEILLDADGVGEFREAEALGETADMRIDDDAFIFIEGVSEDNIRGFASSSGECGEGFKGGWHFAAMLGNEGGTHGAEVFRFVAIETGGADEGLEVLLRNGGVIGCGAATLEEVLGDEVDALVGALRGEDGGDEELERVRVVELAMGIGVDGWEPF